ncbi:sulfurtransferase [Winogradskyella sp. PG-2]|uniref:sulfurtransferase n=1 Tax=Winogradskyella sp. PG-2 TaxID=754409 RepID=UPI0004588F6E|nr:sulfurtransferase [Winogradskyella sp. PG-2]BAO77283.1 thiosulfate sulfurtransferase, rhodanese [Winogradskyella sp. PG-2]
MKFTPNLISVEWLNKNIENPDIIILDATINKVIDASSQRIPKARFFDIKKRFSDVNAPFPSTLPSAEQFQKEARGLGINKDSLIIVYDDKGIYSSARAWWLFKTFRFKNVAVLNGGLPQWILNAFKVEAYSDAVFRHGNFEAKYNSEFMTDFVGVNEFSNNNATLIIDARSEERFNCLVDEPRAGLRRGTIPNSTNLPYTRLFNDYLMKPKTELTVIFNNLVDNKVKFVFSCGSGITACILALAATLCDYKNLIVYDGSWTEYGTLTK